MDTSRDRRLRRLAWAMATGRAGAASATAATAVVTAAAICCAATPAAAWATPASPPGTVTTIAGGLGGPGPARSISIGPCGSRALKVNCGVAFEAGRLYFTDIAGDNLQSGTIRSVSIATGQLTTPAGDGLSNLAGDGGPAGQAGLLNPSDVSFDHAGNMLISDATSVRVVALTTGTFYGQSMTAGHIYTVAGGGASTKSGVPATAAAIKPRGAIVDHAGNIVLCGAGLVRVVAASSGTFYGRPMSAGDIYTIAGGGSSTADAIAATAASIKPSSVIIGAGGNLLITDGTNTRLQNRVRLIAVATGTFYGQPVTAGDIYTLAGGGPSLKEKVPARQTTMAPLGLAADQNGNVVIADFGDNLVRVMAVKAGRFYGQSMKAGFIYAIAGGGNNTSNGAVATSAALRHPVAVTTDGAGNVIVVNQSFQVHAIAARTGSFYRMHMTPGHLYAIAGNGQGWSSGSGGKATKAQFLANGPIAYDAGSLVISADQPTHTSSHEKIRLVPSRSGTFFGRAMTAGHLYVIAGQDKAAPPRFRVPGTEAYLNEVDSLAVDAHGNVLIAEGFGIDVLAAHAGTFYGQAMKTGFLYKIAGDGDFQFSGDGGPAIRAGMNPRGLVVDSHGNIVLADTLRLRVVAARTGSFYGIAMTAGHVYTIAGDGSEGTGGDGGPAKGAQFTVDFGLGLDGQHGLLVSDSGRIRMIATATGTFFGVPMTAGDIYTVAGTGSPGVSGEGGVALTAQITPEAMTVDNAGNLVFYDQQAGRLRLVPATSGTFYGQATAANHLYSIAGGGDGSLGEGGPGSGVSIDFVVGAIAHDSLGIAYPDVNGLRVRLIAE